MQFFKTTLLFLLFCTSITTLHAQSLQFDYGQTSALYGHKSEGPAKYFYSSKGQFIRLSLIQDFLKVHEISFGASLFQANSIGNVITTSLDYETQFLGVFTTSHFNVLSIANRRHCASCTDFNFYFNAGLQLAAMLNGTQKIDSTIYDLKGVEDFKGIWFSPILGAKMQFDASDIISLILTLDYIPMLNITDTDEDFKINTSQIGLGIRLWL